MTTTASAASLALTPGASAPSRSHAHRLGLAPHQALRRQHLFDFGRADAERQRAKCAMRRRVAVAAHDRHAGLRQAELGADHVHDALIAGVEVVERDAVGDAVAREARRAAPAASASAIGRCRAVVGTL